MTKYHAVPTEVDGIRFDSKAEARRYRELILIACAGEIRELAIHPGFVIWEHGKERILYEADFSYYENDKQVVEDVKGVLTPVYRLKKKMFLAMYPDIKFVEVTK